VPANAIHLKIYPNSKQHSYANSHKPLPLPQKTAAYKYPSRADHRSEEEKTPWLSRKTQCNFKITSNTFKNQSSAQQISQKSKKHSKNILYFHSSPKRKSIASSKKWNPAPLNAIITSFGRGIKADHTISFLKEYARYKSMAKKREPSPMEIHSGIWVLSTMLLDLLPFSLSLTANSYRSIDAFSRRLWMISTSYMRNRIKNFYKCSLSSVN